MRYANTGYHTVAIPTMQTPATLITGNQMRGYYVVNDIYNNPAVDDRLSLTRRVVQSFIRKNRAVHGYVQ